MPATTGTYPGHFIHRDPELGYALTPSASATIHRTLRGHRIFDAKYTTTSGGYRVTRGNPSGPTWLFMGCSYTFGEGMNDDATLPARVSSELGYRDNVVNLGTPGYGPHQMLRELELNRIPGVTLPVKHVVFQTIYWHVRRSAGRARWDMSGPRYDLSGDTVAYRGPFHSLKVAAPIYLLGKSATARFFMDRFFFGPDFDDRELEIYARIIQRSARLARERLGADFTILYWDDDNPLARRVLARLRKTGLPIILVSSVMPRSEWNRYRFPREFHPTAEANVLLARYVARALSDSL